MTSLPAYTTDTAPTVQELSAAVVTALAEVRCVAVAELDAEANATRGDLQMDSLEAVAVIAKLETRYGCKLAKVEDLEPEQIASVTAIANIVHLRWPEDASRTQGDDE
jgi:acyl carrier protein